MAFPPALYANPGNSYHSFQQNEWVKITPCAHVFHAICLDSRLLAASICPLYALFSCSQGLVALPAMPMEGVPLSAVPVPVYREAGYPEASKQMQDTQ
jgi:hypothetical protein